MRRLFAYLALAALLLTATLVGCQQETLPASGDAIRFSVAPAAEVELQTKAKPDNNTYLIHENSEVLLYGSFYEDGAATKTPLFNGTGGSTTLKYKALSDATGYAWSYDDLKYWDKRYKYDFRAVFPTTATVVAGSNSSQVDVSYAMADGYDLMVASATDLDAATRMTNSEYTVSLPFQHACAAVQILFKDENVGEDTDGNPMYNYYIKTFSLLGIATSGTYSYGTSTLWTPTGTDYLWSGSWPVPKAATAIEGWYYAIPQAIDGATVHFTYKVGNEEMPVTLDLKIGSITKWEAGTAYTYTITLQANAIDFTVTGEPWAKNEIIVDPVG